MDHVDWKAGGGISLAAMTGILLKNNSIAIKTVTKTRCTSLTPVMLSVQQKGELTWTIPFHSYPSRYDMPATASIGGNVDKSWSEV